MVESAPEKRFEMKREISEQLQEFKECGPEEFLAKKKKKKPQHNEKVNNALVLGSDEEELYEHTLALIA